MGNGAKEPQWPAVIQGDGFDEGLASAVTQLLTREPQSGLGGGQRHQQALRSTLIVTANCSAQPLLPGQGSAPLSLSGSFLTSPISEMKGLIPLVSSFPKS